MKSGLGKILPGPHTRWPIGLGLGKEMGTGPEENLTESYQHELTRVLSAPELQDQDPFY